MKTKLFASSALLALSMGTAQAVTLTHSGQHTFQNEVTTYEFNVDTTSSVDIWFDTFIDGLDVASTLFVKNAGTGAWDWVGFEIAGAPDASFDFVQQFSINGTNDFGVAYKNGFVFQDPNHLGISDDGITATLTQGSYLIAITENLNIANAVFAGSGTFSDGFFDIDPSNGWDAWEFSTGGVASPYDLFIQGDVSAVSAVPVPAAVWLFASAIAGLGAVGRRKSAEMIAA